MALVNNNKQPREPTGEVVFRVNTTRNSHRQSKQHYTHSEIVNVQISKLSGDRARRLNRGLATTLESPNEKARQCAFLTQMNRKVAGKETKTRKVRISWRFLRTATMRHRPQKTTRMREHRSYILNPSPTN